MENVLFEETQRLSPLIILAIVAAVLVVFGLVYWRTGGALSRPVWMLLGGTAVFLAALVAMSRMQTEVTADSVDISMFYLISESIPHGQIAEHQVLEYRPLREFGGWGLRYGSSGRAYSMSGSEGVRLVLDDGSQITLGSQNAEALASAIETGKASP
ncbi:MAG: hypothetical protein AAFY49_01455 [Pseudomonadota bacterium]